MSFSLPYYKNNKTQSKTSNTDGHIHKKEIMADEKIKWTRE